MKFADIITLAKAGYTPKDIKELLELCETDPETKAKEVPEEVKTEPVEPKAEPEPELSAFERLVAENKEE